MRYSFRLKLWLLLAIVAAASVASQFIYRDVIASLHRSLDSALDAVDTVETAEAFHSDLHTLVSYATRTSLEAGAFEPGRYASIRSQAEESLVALVRLISADDATDRRFDFSSDPHFVEETLWLFDLLLRETDALSAGLDVPVERRERARELFDRIFLQHLDSFRDSNQERFVAMQNEAHAMERRVDGFVRFQIGILLLAGIASFLFSDRVLLRGFQAAQRSAMVDGLTGLGNRQYLDGPALASIHAMLEARLPFVLALVDADHFKRFNDRYGHKAGDDALKTIAARLRGGLRRSDTILRYGGEEFLAILGGLDKEAGIAICEKIRELVAQSAIPLPGGGAETITVSLGLAAYPEDGLNSYGALFDLADRRLYAAKAAGRNRVDAAAL